MRLACILEVGWCRTRMHRPMASWPWAISYQIWWPKTWLCEGDRLVIIMKGGGVIKGLFVERFLYSVESVNSFLINECVKPFLYGPMHVPHPLAHAIHVPVHVDHRALHEMHKKCTWTVRCAMHTGRTPMLHAWIRSDLLLDLCWIFSWILWYLNLAFLDRIKIFF